MNCVSIKENNLSHHRNGFDIQHHCDSYNILRNKVILVKTVKTLSAIISTFPITIDQYQQYINQSTKLPFKNTWMISMLSLKRTRFARFPLAMLPIIESKPMVLAGVSVAILIASTISIPAISVAVRIKRSYVAILPAKQLLFSTNATPFSM